MLKQLLTSIEKQLEAVDRKIGIVGSDLTGVLVEVAGIRGKIENFQDLKERVVRLEMDTSELRTKVSSQGYLEKMAGGAPAIIIALLALLVSIFVNK